MDTKIQKALRVLEAAHDAFAPNVDVSFDGLYSRFHKLDPEAYRGAPFRQASTLLNGERKPSDAAPEFWSFQAGDFLLPQYWEPTNGSALSFSLLQASPADGITIAGGKDVVKIGAPSDPYTTDQPCWFWISPVRQGPMIVMARGRLEARPDESVRHG